MIQNEIFLFYFFSTPPPLPRGWVIAEPSLSCPVAFLDLSLCQIKTLLFRCRKQWRGTSVLLVENGEEIGAPARRQ